MKRGVWLGGLLLLLAGRPVSLRAQENVWRPIQRLPDPPRVGYMAPRPMPAVLLGRPVPVPVESAARADDGGLVQTSYNVQPAHNVVPAGPALPDGVIAASVPPMPRADEGDNAGEPFATQRGGPRPLQLPPGKPTPEIAAPNNWKLGDWKEKYPVTGSPPPPAYAPEGPPPSCFYVNGEYLLWFSKHDRTPPLLTTGTFTGNPAVDQTVGALGRGDTVVLFGGPLNVDPQSGARFTGGWWVDDCHTWALEFSGFFLGQHSKNFAASSAFTPVLTRPFFDLNHNQQSEEIIALPGVSTGGFSVHAPSQIWGLEANAKCQWCCGCDYHVNLLGGFRYLNLHENITITENVQGGPNAPAPFTNASVIAVDSFSTRNEFFGVQVGAQYQWHCGCWGVDVLGKVAVGDTAQAVDILGSQTFTNPAGPVDPRPGGLLALGTNIGHHTKDKISVVPEIGVNLSYRVTDHLRAYVGYNFLFWTNVLRPGQQIDTNLDITKIPNFAVPPGTMPLASPHPFVPFKETDYWTQGLVFGLEYIF
jgi:hypothetical protein